MKTKERNGFLLAGNWAINYLKIVDHFPSAYTFSKILNESICNAGAAYNMTTNLRRLDPNIKLEVAGCIGQDLDGKNILEDCVSMGVDVSRMKVVQDSYTGYTDIITAKKTGERYCFDKVGANAAFEGQGIDFKKTDASFFYLGTLMALPGLDAKCKKYGSKAANLLHEAQKSGLKTCAAGLRNEYGDYEIYKKSLPYLDYVLLSEFEAEKLTGITLRYMGIIDEDALNNTANSIIQSYGQEVVVISFRGGCYMQTKTRESYILGEVRLPRGKILSSVGEQHAFQSGFLYGLYYGYTYLDCLKLAQSVKASSMMHASASSGISTVDKCKKLAEEYGFRFI